jgi:5,10-methylenetetrahydromethanopterin reductase
MKFTFSNLPATGWALPAAHITELARLAEDVGFDRFAVADLPFHYECTTVMTACLLATRHLQVESLVTNPYTRDPALVAATFATMADLSDGRAILGIGGGVESATRIYVAPWAHERPHPATAVREAIHVYRRMWRGERVTFDGEIVHVHDVALDCPLPVRIPILVAARGPVMLRLAGEVADIAHLASLFLDTAHQRENVRTVLEGLRGSPDGDRAIEIDMSITASVSQDRELARREARRNAAQTILWMAGTDSHNKRRRDWKRPAELGVDERVVSALTNEWDMWREPELPRRLESLIDDETLDRFTVAGEPAECAARLRAIADTFPEVTGFRLKLPRPVRSATYESYVASIRGMGAVIARFRADTAPAAATRDASTV